ncbi:MAG: YneF family protein [Mycoplasmataceae bacterium]|nr:YneF family protein [Mycoplasmataceae bacterium]
MPAWGIALVVILPIVCLIVGGIVGFAISQKMVKKQLKENPPITADQIRDMYRQMGRTPSEAQISQIMHRMRNQDKK